MTLFELVSRLELSNYTPSLGRLLNAEAARAMVSDVPSDVLSLARSGTLLVTAQSELNMLAVAAHNQLAAVLLTSGARPDEAMAGRACEKNVPLLGTELTSFDAAGRLYGLGLRGETK